MSGREEKRRDQSRKEGKPPPLEGNGKAYCTPGGRGNLLRHFQGSSVSITGGGGKEIGQIAQCGKEALVEGVNSADAIAVQPEVFGGSPEDMDVVLGSWEEREMERG